MFSAPDDVYVYGSGRWARVILSVLRAGVPAQTRIHVISAHHGGAMMEWLGRHAWADVNVRDSLPDHVESGAVIVANATRDHERAARESLERRLPVLVEKPLAQSGRAAKELIELSEARRTYLGAAHVFLFAEYIHRFAALAAQRPALSRIRFQWFDTRGEYRYGEEKKVDATVPIVLDVLPHVLSILGALVPGAVCLCRGVRGDPAGESVALELALGDVPCFVEMSRVGEKRTRVIELTTPRGDLALDFSTEPGMIDDNGRMCSADPSWESRPRPLAQQLEAFLAGCLHGRWDPRLDPQLAWKTSLLVDQALTGDGEPASDRVS